MLEPFGTEFSEKQVNPNLEIMQHSLHDMSNFV